MYTSEWSRLQQKMQEERIALGVWFWTSTTRQTESVMNATNFLEDKIVRMHQNFTDNLEISIE